MRGDKFVVIAETESDAFKILHKLEPQTVTWDILKVEYE